METVVDNIDATEETQRENLAQVMQIANLEAIVNRDRIETCVVGGYRGIVEKGLHNIDNWVVVFRYDSILPERPIFEFMRQFKFRVKSKKFNIPDNPAIYSQVIILPIDLVETEYGITLPREESYECASLLEIKKYIPKASGESTSFGIMKPKGDFPSEIISKTDEVNVASKIRLINELKDLPYYISVKVDGSSFTAIKKDEDVTVCSRNLQIQECEGNKFWEAANKYDLKNIIKYNNGLGIQGELCGPGIQKNKLGLSEVDLFVFNIIDLSTRRRIHIDDQIKFCERHGLKHVDIVEFGDSFNYTYDELIAKIITQKYVNTENPIEGYVIRPKEDFFSKTIQGSFSFKLMNPEYIF